MKRTRSLPKKKVSSTQSRQEILAAITPRKVDTFLVRFFSFVIRFFIVIGIFSLGVFAALSAVGFITGSLYLRSISATAGVSQRELLSLARDARGYDIAQTDGRKNILILGVDTLSNRDTQSVLTDTIMLASVHLKSGKITTVSFPRDLYVEKESAKINALYEKGKGNEGFTLIKGTVEELSGLPVHNVLVLDIATVGKLIDAVGGLDVVVDRSFVDYKFPRTDVDVRTERDESKLYEVVAFTQGIEHMSGDRALRFIRSRHSLDPQEGTDDARVRRQQKVISALLTKLKDTSIIRRPEEIGRLISLYTLYFDSSIPLVEVAAIGQTLVKSQATPQLVSVQLPVKESGKDGLIFHPERHASGAWVYLLVDPTGKELRTFIQTNLSK